MISQARGKLIIGNCLDVLGAWPDECVHLTVTSPPYDKLRDYKGYDFPFVEDIAERTLSRDCGKGGVVVWVVGDRINGGTQSDIISSSDLLPGDREFSVHDVMIYQKKNTPFTRSNAYTNAYEMMFVLVKRKPANFQST